MKADDPEKSGKDRAYDGEMDVWGVLERQKAQWGLYNLLGIIVLLMWWGVEDWEVWTSGA